MERENMMNENHPLTFSRADGDWFIPVAFAIGLIAGQERDLYPLPDPPTEVDLDEITRRIVERYPALKLLRYDFIGMGYVSTDVVATITGAEEDQVVLVAQLAGACARRPEELHNIQ